MDTLLAKETTLRRVISSYKSSLTAFSGGVDSSLVAYVAASILKKRALAVIADSYSLKREDFIEAKKLCSMKGIRLAVLQTNEFQKESYLQNDTKRCYYCKQSLYQEMTELRKKADYHVIFNGTNVEDMQDYRPGHIAANEYAVVSPLQLAGLGKSEIRALARKYDLPNFLKPASPCLSSRLAYGIRVTRERLKRIELAEAIVRNSLDFQSAKPLQIQNLRVRLLSDSQARVEMDSQLWPLFNEKKTLIAAEMQRLGFSELSLHSYKKGALLNV